MKCIKVFLDVVDFFFENAISLFHLYPSVELSKSYEIFRTRTYAVSLTSSQRALLHYTLFDARSLEKQYKLIDISFV